MLMPFKIKDIKNYKYYNFVEQIKFLISKLSWLNVRYESDKIESYFIIIFIVHLQLT